MTCEGARLAWIANDSRRIKERLGNGGDPQPDGVALVIARREAALRLLSRQHRRSFAEPILEHPSVDFYRLGQRHSQ